MARAQNGYIPVPNHVAEALTRVNLSPYESRFVWCVLRLTYGWRKKEDSISLSRIAKMSGLQRGHASRARASLVHRHILVRREGQIALNQKHETWLYSTANKGRSSVGAPLQERSSTGLRRSYTGNIGAPLQEPQQTIKDTIVQTLYSRNSHEFRLSELLLNLILQRNPNFQRGKLRHRGGREKLLQSWAVHVDRLLRIDDRSAEQIEKVIRWCQADDFWQNNILSTSKLRERFDQLELKMQGPKNGQTKAKYDRDSAGQPATQFIR